MDPDFDLFVAIVDSGSLSAAARTLGMSPAMVSKRLRRLEERLGTRLLHRSTRRMALTAQGEQLVSDLRGIGALIRQAEERVAGASDVPTGPLRITAPTSFGRMHLAPHIGAFLSRHPQVELALDLSDAFVDLIGAQVDCAIRITAEVPAGLVAHRLATSERVLCAAPDYLDVFGAPDNIGDLGRHRMLAATGQLPWRLTGPEGSVAIDGPSHVRTNSSEVVRELALQGAGIALRSLWDVNEALASGKLRRILPAYEGSADIAIFAIHPPTPVLSAALTAFLDFVKDLYAPSPPWETGTAHHGPS